MHLDSLILDRNEGISYRCRVSDAVILDGRCNVQLVFNSSKKNYNEQNLKKKCCMSGDTGHHVL